ncbi:hypothetical protein MBLNU457_1473t1 [Dothideomycetes sp. NU457]
MATTEAIPSINFPHLGQDDDMELSSDHGRYDGDFDIDIDQGGDYEAENDVDQMQEDLRSDRGMTDLLDPPDGRMNDDEMAEGSIDGRYEPQDGMMQDEGTPPEVHDEDLGDYVGDESGYTQEQGLGFETQDVEAFGTQEDTQYDDGTGDTTLRPDEQAFHTGDDHLEQSYSAEVNETVSLGETQREVPNPSDAVPQTSTEKVHSPARVDQEHLVASQEFEPTVANSAEPQNADDPAEVQDKSDENPAHHREQYQDEYEQQEQEQSINTAEAEHDETAEDDDRHNDELEDNESQTVVGDNAHSTLRDHAIASTVTGLHPTIVRYEGSEVFLFPSADLKSQEEYFLEDENLVNGSIGDMLESCRVVLGGDISEDDELELTVEDLGLSLSEDSTPAFSASFSEILQLYVQLQVLDGVEQPPPMYMTLSTRTRFTNRLTLLTQAVREGKGLSSIPHTKEMMYDEDETFTEYHEPEGDDQEVDVEETPSGHAVDRVEHADNERLQDETTLAADEHELNSSNVEHAQTVEEETAEPTEHNYEAYQSQEGDHIQDPVVNEESQLATTQLDVEQNTNTGKEDNETALEEVTAVDNLEHSHTALDGRDAGDEHGSSNAEDTHYGADGVHLNEDAGEIEGDQVTQLIGGDDQSKPNDEEKEEGSHEADGQQEDVTNPSTTGGANDDLPSVPEDDLDEIDFDDDEIDNITETNASNLKRSFTEHAEYLDTAKDEQASKRSRS